MGLLMSIACLPKEELEIDEHILSGKHVVDEHCLPEEELEIDEHFLSGMHVVDEYSLPEELKEAEEEDKAPDAEEKDETQICLEADKFEGDEAWNAMEEATEGKESDETRKLAVTAMVRDSGHLFPDKIDAVNPSLDIDGKIATFLQSTRQQLQQQQAQFLEMIGMTPAKEFTADPKDPAVLKIIRRINSRSPY